MQSWRKHDAVRRRLISAREKKGLGVNELARAIGVRSSTISRIESGQRNPSVHVMNAWLKACDYTAEAVGESPRAADLAAAVDGADHEAVDAAIHLLRVWSRTRPSWRRMLADDLREFESKDDSG